MFWLRLGEELKLDSKVRPSMTSLLNQNIMSMAAPCSGLLTLLLAERTDVFCSLHPISS